MFERKLMISAIRRQQDLLFQLIREIERIQAQAIDNEFEDKTYLIAENLRRLREIKDSYLINLNNLN